MKDSISPLPLMDVKMLRPDTESFLQVAWPQARLFQTPLGLKEKPLFDRYRRCAGLIFKVPELTTRGKRGTDWDATRVYLAAVLTEANLKLADLCAASPPGEKDINVVLELPARVITNPPISRLLQSQSESLKSRGVRLVLSIPSGTVAALPKAVQKSAFKSLYALKDVGAVIAANTARYSTIPSECRMVAHSTIIVLTPKTLGISTNSATFSLSDYTDRISNLNYLIHEQNKTIFLKDIKNKWQLEFINALPIHYYSL